MAARARGWTPLVGLVSGLALGVVARGWMRYISDDHEFTWSGTLGIVIGFGVFGAAQATAAWSAQLDWRRWARRISRCAAGVAMLPLFAAAGAVMAPTVVFGGLAAWRTRWPPSVRAAMAAIVLVDIILVSRIITDDFGWSARSVLGIGWMLGIYAALVWCTEGTLRAAPSHRSTEARAIATVDYGRTM